MGQQTLGPVRCSGALQDSGSERQRHSSSTSLSQWHGERQRESGSEGQSKRQQHNVSQWQSERLICRCGAGTYRQTVREVGGGRKDC